MHLKYSREVNKTVREHINTCFLSLFKGKVSISFLNHNSHMRKIRVTHRYSYVCASLCSYGLLWYIGSTSGTASSGVMSQFRF